MITHQTRTKFRDWMKTSNWRVIKKIVFCLRCVVKLYEWIMMNEWSYVKVLLNEHNIQTRSALIVLVIWCSSFNNKKKGSKVQSRRDWRKWDILSSLTFQQEMILEDIFEKMIIYEHIGTHEPVNCRVSLDKIIYNCPRVEVHRSKIISKLHKIIYP